MNKTNESPEEEVEIISSGFNEIAYQETKAEIDIQVSTAKAYPRNIKRATENAIAVATMDKETAETCTYSVPRGGKPITGKSVHLARIVAQLWGNLRVDSRVVNIDATHVTSQAICWDLETNYAAKIEVKRSIMQNEYKWVNGKNERTGRMIRMNEDMITVTGNAGNAIAFRNVVLAVIPKSVTDKVYKSAMQLITGDISDETKLIKKRKKVIDALMGTYNVTEAEVLSAIGKASVDHVGAEEIVVLIGLGTAIKDGDTTVDQAFRSGKTKEKEKNAPTSGAKQIKDLIVEMGTVKTKPELNKIWDENKSFQKDKSFIEAYENNEARIETSTS